MLTSKGEVMTLRDLLTKSLGFERLVTEDYLRRDDAYSVLVRITRFEIIVKITYKIERRGVMTASFVGRDKEAIASEYLNEFCAKWT